MKNRLSIRLSAIASSLICMMFCFQACIDPVLPEFDFRDGVLFVDAYALTKENTSYVSISESQFLNNSYSTLTVENADVRFINVGTGEEVVCTQASNGRYFPPFDFSPATGEQWRMTIVLEDGRRIESEIETINESIPIGNISAQYSDELYFDESFARFVPGHEISIDWDDPEGEENFYLWKYRSFEPLAVCLTCEGGQFRNGACDNSFRFGGYQTYICPEPCWRIRFSDQFQITDDRLINGQNVTGQRIADVPYFRAVDILVEIQQLSLTKSAFEYFQIIDDIFNESGGLNAPPPAALIGNLYNPDDRGDIILGQFTASGIATKTIYIERGQLPSEALTPDRPERPEVCPLICPNDRIFFPCIEGNFRTSMEPEGWTP